ncbi:cytochrome b/b6 domain-containing protein [Gemmobacter lanyuensis]
MVPVWDRFVRVFHWGLVTLIAVCWLTADEIKSVHEAAGYLVAGLIAARLVWGSSAPATPALPISCEAPGRAGLSGAATGGARAALPGPQPSRGAMIVALIATVAGTALTGWLQTTDMFWGSEMLEEVHELLATLILCLAGIHIAGVVFESLRHRENLVTAMIDGRKRASERPHN